MSDPKGRKQALDESVRVAMQPSTYEGSRWAVFISFIALIVAVFSLYENRSAVAE